VLSILLELLYNSQTLHNGKSHKCLPQSTERKKMATGTFTYNAWRAKALKERIKAQRKIISNSNPSRAMLFV